jgi:hypothetical protein
MSIWSFRLCDCLDQDVIVDSVNDKGSFHK